MNIETSISNCSISFDFVESAKRKRAEKGKPIKRFLNNYIVVDIETTGLSPDYDQIIEISAIKIENNNKVGSFSSLIKPDIELDEFITELTGITNDMLSEAPSIDSVLPLFIEFVDDMPVIGHNVNFDINFIYDNCKLYLDRPFRNGYVDTMRLSKLLFPNLDNYKLITLVKRFGIKQETFHRSLADCYSTYELYNYLRKYAEDNSIDISSLTITNAKKFDARDIKATTENFCTSHPLYNKNVVFTGVLEKMSRTDAAQLVVNLGGICQNGVTKKTNYLVLGNNDYCSNIKDGKSSKQKKAEAYKLSGYDIEIIPENTFYDLVLDE